MLRIRTATSRKTCALHANRAFQACPTVDGGCITGQHQRHVSARVCNGASFSREDISDSHEAFDRLHGLQLQLH